MAKTTDRYVVPAPPRTAPLPSSSSYSRGGGVIQTGQGLASGPDTRRFRDIPALALAEFNEPEKIRSALAQMNQGGHFHAAALLMDQMLGDDRIASTIGTRVDTLLGLDVDIEPADDSAQAQACADDIKKNWSRMFNRAQLRQIITSGLLLGIGLGENVWTQIDGQWVQKLRYWHPQFIYWRWDLQDDRSPSGRFVVITNDGIVEVPEDGGGGKWFVFCPFGYYLGWKRALVRPLSVPYLLRQLSYFDWARYNEIHGKPIMGAVMPQSALPKAKEDFVDQLFNIGSNAVLEMPQGSDGNKWDLKLIEAMSQGYECFDALIDRSDRAITLVVKGENLTTEVDGGSLAASRTHDNVRHDVMDYDAECVDDTINEHGVKPFSAFNYTEDLAPTAKHVTEPPEDLADKTTMLSNLGSALVAFKTAAAPVDVRAVLEQLSIPALSEQEVAKQQDDEQQRQLEIQQAAQPPPGAGGEGEGGAPPGGEGSPPAKAKTTALSAKVPPGAAAGQAYIDDVTEAAIRRGGDAIHVDLQRVLAEVGRASSVADVRRRLLQVLPRMSREGFALVMEKACLMARVAGKASVWRDL